MANKLITPQLLRVFEELEKQQWVTSNDVASCTGNSPRCCRKHLAWLVEKGLAEVQVASPGYRYKRVTKVTRANELARAQIQTAREAFKSNQP